MTSATFVHVRAKEDIVTKLASVSNLRCTEQVGFRTDAMCMSEAGLGHIANALRDDPYMDDKTNVLVLTGTNGIRNPAFENRHSYAYMVDTCVQKVKAAIPASSNLAFDHLTSDLGDDKLDPDLRFREAQELERAQDDKTRVITIPRPFIDLDSSGNPTREGTAGVLRELGKIYPGFVLNQEFLTTDRL